MKFPFPGIGIVFDIEGLGGGFYGNRAWRLFMKHFKPDRLGVCILLEGDTAATLSGQANEFCIGIYGPNLDLNYIRETIESLDEPGLAPMHRRFIEKLALDMQPLPIRGNIDAFGCLVTEQWTRIDHDLCKEAGWRYNPKEVLPSIEPSLQAELKQLKSIRHWKI